MLGKLFPFVNRLFSPRIPAPEAAYLPVRDTSDTNQRNVFEAHYGPPGLDFMNSLQRVGLAPGPEGCFPDLPFVEAPVVPFVQQGGILTTTIDGDNPLYTAPESAPESEIF